MAFKIQEQGRYELFKTNHRNRILVLNDQWFAWVQGQQGEILVQTDSDHVRDHTLSEGKFYLVDFINDPKFKDVPHLFLQEGNHYREWVVPHGLPTEEDPQKAIVPTDEALREESLESYLAVG